MTTHEPLFEDLLVALNNLLRAKDREGNRLLYAEHREPVRDTVAVELCRVCGEVDEHGGDCAVGAAERVLRQSGRVES